MSVIEYLAIAWVMTLAVNMVPAFMPPTWSIVSYFLVSFNLPLLPLTIGCALASTVGRVCLCLATRRAGPHFMTVEMKRNMEALAAFLQGQTKRIILGLVFIAPVSPVPSNQLFLAAGLAQTDLKVIAPCFFVGRLAEYTLVAVAAGRVANDLSELLGGPFASTQALLLELVSLAGIVAFVLIPWARLLRQPIGR